MNMRYESLQEKYGDASEKKDEAPIVAEKAELNEPTLSSEAEESSTGADSTESENEHALEEHVPNEADESSKPREETELCAFLKEEREALAALGEQLVLLDQKVTAFGASLEQIKQTESKESNGSLLIAKLEELCQSVSKQEKANIDILRDSKNFQASVREQMQRELDDYHKMHSEAANAPILTDIANLYILSSKAISFLANEKERKNVSEIVLEGLLEILEEQGVTVNSTPAGGKRSLKTCKTRKTIPTGDSALHGMVAESITPSFTLGNHVLIKECIDTYVYDAALAMPKKAPEISPEEADANHDESSERPDASELERNQSVPEESQTTEETVSGSASCINEGPVETVTSTEGNK